MKAWNQRDKFWRELGGKETKLSTDSGANVGKTKCDAFNANDATPDANNGWNLFKKCAENNRKKEAIKDFAVSEIEMQYNGVDKYVFGVGPSTNHIPVAMLSWPDMGGFNEGDQFPNINYQLNPDTAQTGPNPAGQSLTGPHWSLLTHMIDVHRLCCWTVWSIVRGSV